MCAEEKNKTDLVNFVLKAKWFFYSFYTSLFLNSKNHGRTNVKSFLSHIHFLGWMDLLPADWNIICLNRSVWSQALLSFTGKRELMEYKKFMQ